MNKHSDRHSAGHPNRHSGKTKHFPDDHPPAKKSGRGLHQDWRAWCALGLMLFAIIAYVLSLDESIRPEINEQPGVPANAP